MRTNDKIALNTILLHKNSFNQKLIDISRTLDFKVTSLTSSNANLTSSKQSYKKTIANMRLKVKY